MAGINRKRAQRDWVETLPFPSIVVTRTTTVFRNLSGFAFPERLSDEERKTLRDRICDALSSKAVVSGRRGVAIKGGDDNFMPEVDRLHGYGWVSPEFILRASGSAVVSIPGPLSVLVNDEDHLTFICSDSVPLNEQWKRVKAAASAFGRRIPYARHSTYGYLSANPDHVGTGLRVSASLCLFGLYLMKALDPVLNGLERLGFSVTPMFVPSEPEDHPLDAPGCCYRIHSPQMLAQPEAIIARSDHVFAEVARQEAQARERLRQERFEVLQDFVLRAIGVGSLAVQVSESEGIDMVCAMRLGLDLGVPPDQGDAVDSATRLILPQIMGAGVRQMLPGRSREDLDEFKQLRAQLIRPLAMAMMPASLATVAGTDDQMEEAP